MGASQGLRGSPGLIIFPEFLEPLLRIWGEGLALQCVIEDLGFWKSPQTYIGVLHLLKAQFLSVIAFEALNK